MSLPKDLLSQAQYLAKREPKRPRQASLRRAVSTAYYALFHLLTEDASSLLLRGGSMGKFRPMLRRAFQHTEMKDAAKAFATGSAPSPVASVVPAVSSALVDVATTFVDLQEARHEADYDFSRNFTRSEVLDLVDRVADSLQKWQAIRKHTDAQAFLLALIVHKRWRR